MCARSLRKTMSRSQNCKNQQNSSKYDVLTLGCRNLVATLIPALHFSLSLAWLSSCCQPPWRRRRRTEGGKCHAEGDYGDARGVVDIILIGGDTSEHMKRPFGGIWISRDQFPPIGLLKLSLVMMFRIKGKMTSLTFRRSHSALCQSGKDL